MKYIVMDLEFNCPKNRYNISENNGIVLDHEIIATTAEMIFSKILNIVRAFTRRGFSDILNIERRCR